MRQWYWAEIKLPEKIVFYTSKELQRRGLLDYVEDLRSKWQLYKRWVTLPDNVVEKLENVGVKVLRKIFLALKGTWHWFSGFSNMDAFRLNPELEAKLNRDGFFEITFETKPRVIVEPTKEILYVVSCTRDKVWDFGETKKYIPAKDAYVGTTMKSWLSSTKSRDYPWVIFSSKYGFIDPDHPIKNYDINFVDDGDKAVSEETLFRQLMHHDFECNGERFKICEFKEIRFVGSPKYYNKLKTVFDRAGLKFVMEGYR